VTRHLTYPLVIALGLIGLLASMASADPDTEPVNKSASLLQHEEPHDLIRVKGESKEPLKVFPVDLPGRRMPTNPNPASKLMIRLLEKPTERYTIEWRNVDRLVLFEDRVLAQARQLVEDKKFDLAYEVITFLQETYPQVDRLAEVSALYLHTQARDEIEHGNWRAALALLHDLAIQQRDRPGVADDLLKVSNRLIDESLERNEVGAARRFIGGFIARYPEHAEIGRWKERFQKEANDRLELARQAIAKQQSSVARREVYEALARVPDLKEAQALIDQLSVSVVSVSIGTRTPPLDQPGIAPLRRMLDSAARRDNRLLERSLIELTEIGITGGNYRPLVGKLEKEELTAGLTWKLLSDGGLTGFDVARLLAHSADPRAPQPTVWSSVLERLAVSDVYRVEARLRWVHLLPEALIAGPLGASPSVPATAVTAQIHPYAPTRHSRTHVQYRLHELYVPKIETTPLELNVVSYDDDSSAENALQRGRVDLLDYVPPWEVAEWAERKEFAVEPYRVPTMHVLLLNRSHPLLQSRSFRRGLIYALDRQAMLTQLVLRGKKLPSAEVQSGPFPRGVDTSDPLGYAFAPLIKPRPFDPDLAATMIALAQAPTPGEAPADKSAATVNQPLRFVHPATPVARVAAKAIARQWSVLGVSVELNELPPGDVGLKQPGDILYAEVSMAEPLVEARVLLGPGSLAGGSPYIAQALDDLDRTTEWSEARRILHHIHQLVYDDAALIPLWQLNDHYVRSRRLEGIGTRPMTLFQAVEQWRLAMRPPVEKDTLWPSVVKKP
jgi:hypothetical protein